MVPYFVLVEDNRDDCEAIIRGFKANDCPYPIQWFQNSSDALDHLLDTTIPSPRLLFLDLNMPGIDGRSLLKHIKAQKKLRPIPIIVFTTSADQKDITSCYSHGVSSYIQKPIQFQKMKEICGNILNYWTKTCLLSDSVDLSKKH